MTWKGKKSSDLETSSEKDQIGEESPCTEATRENEQTFFVETYIRKNLELENYSIVFTLGNRLFLSATSVLSKRPKPLVYNTTAFLDKLKCTDLGKRRDRFGRFFLVRK